MRVLICLDRTDFAKSILPVARRFAAASGADVELVTVVEAPTRGGEPWSGQRPEPVDPQLIRAAREELEAAATDFVTAPRTTVLEGHDAADAILRHARATHPDLIALATHSRGALGEAALGSTAREVTRSGVAPVLLFHPLAAVGMRTADIPLGVHAFTSDGELLGQVVEVTPGRLRIWRVSGGDLWLPASVAGAITTGQLALDIAATDIAELAHRV